jgi:Ca-activated chloride channel family protein
VPGRVVAATRFEVSFSGPDGPGDYVALTVRGAREGQYVDWAYTAVGSPVSLPAPDNPGVFEVRYVRGSDEATLASVEITVEVGP